MQEVCFKLKNIGFSVVKFISLVKTAIAGEDANWGRVIMLPLVKSEEENIIQNKVENIYLVKILVCEIRASIYKKINLR